MVAHRGRCTECRRRRTALRKQERAQREHERADTVEQQERRGRNRGSVSNEMYAWSGWTANE